MSIIRDRRGTPLFDLPFNVANREIEGLEDIYKFGRVTGLDAAEKTVWTGSTVYIFPSIATKMYIASTHSVDVCTGDIIKAVEIQYLDGLWDRQTEVHCLNGRTPVEIIIPVLRNNRMKFLSNCYTHVNTGAIWMGTSDFTAGVPVGKYGHIPSGMNQTHQGFYSVPGGHNIRIYDTYISVNEGKESNTWMRACIHSEVFSGFPGLKNTYEHKNHYDIFQTVFTSQRKIPLLLPEKTDIEFKASGSAGGNVNLSIEWTMLQVGSSYFSNPNG